MKHIANIARREADSRNVRACLIVSMERPGWYYQSVKRLPGGAEQPSYSMVLYIDEIDERKLFTNFQSVREHFENDELEIVKALYGFFRDYGSDVQLRPKKELEIKINE